MAQRVELEVTVPVHGPGGVITLQPGHRFASMAEVPEGVPVRPVFAAVPDEPEPEQGPDPAPEPPPSARAPARGGKGAGG